MSDNLYYRPMTVTATAADTITLAVVALLAAVVLTTIAVLASPRP